MRVKQVHVKRNKVRITLDTGKKLPEYKIKVIEHEPHVASNTPMRGKKIRIDNDMVDKKSNLKLLGVHEVVERELLNKGFSEKYAHTEATRVERNYCYEHFGANKWRSYSQQVNKISKKEKHQRRG